MLLVPLIICLGLGGHAGKLALAPAQPALEALGLSPTAYAILASIPLLAGVVAPAIWGSAYTRHEALILILVPFGVFLGNLLLVCAFALDRYTDYSTLSGALTAVGLVVFGISRSGVGVLQHSELARAVPVGLTLAFVFMVACTHAIGMACNAIVPPLVADEGLLGMQLWLLVPSGISAVSGFVLSLHSRSRPANTSRLAPRLPHRSTSTPHHLSLHETPPQDTCRAASAPQPAMLHEQLLPDSASKGCSCANAGDALDRVRAFSEDAPAEEDSETEERRSKIAILLIAVWHAIMLGLCKSFQSVTSGLLVSLGMTPSHAGMLNATNQFRALLLLPVVAVISDCIGRRIMIGGCSLAITWASWLLLWGSTLVSPPTVEAIHAGLLIYAIVGVASPVILFSIVPFNTKKLAWAFGLVETTFAATEIALNMAIGGLRESVGFGYVLGLFCVCGVAATAAALPLAYYSREDATYLAKCVCFDGKIYEVRSSATKPRQQIRDLRQGRKFSGIGRSTSAARSRADSTKSATSSSATKMHQASGKLRSILRRAARIL